MALDNGHKAVAVCTRRRNATVKFASIWLFFASLACACTSTQPCNPCATAVAIDVVDAAGKPITSAVLQGVTGAVCANGRCSFPLGEKARALHLGVSAAGYVSTDFDFAISVNASTEPCACPLTFEQKTVTLVKS